MAFLVTIDQFEGPLDLMLYLIKESKLDLFDLDLVVLTNQYIQYISEMKSNNLQIASEYLSEMAGLIEYKSKKLLPRDNSELDVEAELKDPNSLVSRLIEYQRFKEVSIELSQRFLERQNEFNIPSKIASIQRENNIDAHYEHDIYDLIKAMSKVIVRQQALNPQAKVVLQTEYSIDDRIDEIRKFLVSHQESFDFSTLFEPEHPLNYKIVTFLAVLDLIRMNEMAFNQQGDTIILKGIS